MHSSFRCHIVDRYVFCGGNRNFLSPGNNPQPHDTLKPSKNIKLRIYVVTRFAYLAMICLTNLWLSGNSIGVSWDLCTSKSRKHTKTKRVNVVRTILVQDTSIFPNVLPRRHITGLRDSGELLLCLSTRIMFVSAALPLQLCYLCFT